MPRQPFAPLLKRTRRSGGRIEVGNLGQRPELEALVANCVMAWPPTEAEMALLLGYLLGAHENDAMLAVFQSLRRSAAQRDAISEAARVRLDSTDRELLNSILKVHKAVEAERNALTHGHFGTYTELPDILLWMETKYYVELKAKMQLRNAAFNPEIQTSLYENISFYKKSDLEKIFADIKEMNDIWSAFIQYLRSSPPKRAELYRQLCDRPRIHQELVLLRRERTR
jgi:hypothetical protein